MIHVLQTVRTHLRQESIAAGVVPQSSWSFKPQTPASTCSIRGAWWLSLPLPVMPTLTGRESKAWSIALMWVALGVHVVAFVPVLHVKVSGECW